MLGTQLLTCVRRAAQGGILYIRVYFIELKIQHAACGHCPAQDVRSDTGYPSKWIQIVKFSSLRFCLFVCLFFTLRSLRVTGTLIFFFSFFFFLLQLSLLLQATGTSLHHCPGHCRPLSRGDYWNSGGERCSSCWGPFSGSPGREQSGRRQAPLSSTGWMPKSFTLPVSANSR